MKATAGHGQVTKDESGAGQEEKMTRAVVKVAPSH